MNEYVLMTYYAKYLKEIRKVSDSTVKHYQEALKYISKYLAQKGKIQQTIYEIGDIDELKIIKEYLYTDSDFIAIDKRGHQMYSVGFNHYFKFASGEGFTNLRHQINVMDVEVPVAEEQTISQVRRKRSSIIKIQSLESAGYLCEINPKHLTFTAKSTGRPYMEGHHLLLMKYQDKFDKSLDVYANIICLCPICHRLLHYGVENEKKNVLDQLYYERVDRLVTSGIRISKNEFDKLVI